MANLVTCIALLLTLFVFSKAKEAPTYDVPAVFVFGDSTVDTGNNNKLVTVVKANFPPYGEAFFNKKATGRFSDGKLVPDYVVSALNLSDSLPPYAGHKVTANDFGVCFASAGTGLDDETATRFNVHTLAQQVEELRLYVGNMTALKGEAETHEFLKKSLFITSVGSNDIMISYNLFLDRRTRYTLPQYHAFLLDRHKAFLQQLYELGARNFLVTGLPPIGCLPIQLTLESLKKSIIPGMPAARFPNKCIQDQNNAAASYNKKLQQMIQELLMKFNSKERTRVVYLDNYNRLLDMSNNPKKYGFTETKRGCCGSGLVEMGPLCNSLDLMCSNPSQYMFFDSVHGTQATYKVVAEDVMKVVHAMLAN
ncbi:GDSL esterase/lipase At2g40250-like [Carex rostrata]